MKKESLIIGLLAALAIIILPAMVLANCQWADIGNCTDLGNGWGQAGQDSFCDSGWRRGSDRCCCGPDGESIGCCRTQILIAGGGPGTHYEYYGQLTNMTKCQSLHGDYFAGWIVNRAQSENSTDVCVGNQSICSWYLNTSCADAGLVLAVDQSWCRASERPNGAAICCCGRNVTQTTTTSTNPFTVPTQPNYNYSNITNPLQTTDVSVVIGRIIKAFLAIIGSILLLIIIYGGFLWMTAAGNPARVTKGRNTLIWGILGVIVIFLAWILVSYIFEALAV
jgi:hypothetical protein